jgi:hypothetical protein
MVVHPLRAYPGLHRHQAHTTRLAAHCTWLLEVSLILVNLGILTIIHCSLCYITHSSMLEQTDIQLIETILNLPEEQTMTKSSLVKLRAVKQQVTGIRDKECFCSGVRRKVWYKDFLTWYEANT